MGLGKWVSGQTTIFWGHLDGYFRKCIRKLLCGAEQAWILKEVFREEVQIFRPKRVELLINGIPDLFPNYSEGLGSQRKARAHQLRLLNEKSNHIGTVRFLHLGLCSREKGIFLELEFLRRWTEIFPENPPKLRMCGVFDSKETEAQFRAATAALDVECIGAVDGAEKKHALQNADVLLFFSQLPETMGLVVVEAMSAGLLPFVAKGNNIESILERADLCAIDLLSPLEGVRRAVKEYNPDRLRALFVEHYIVSVFALRVRKALSESQL
jgi:glycosyltransferase involved in cell wall biosynthesis